MKYLSNAKINLNLMKKAHYLQLKEIIINIVDALDNAAISSKDKNTDTITIETIKKVIVFSGKTSELTNKSNLAKVLKSRIKTRIIYAKATKSEKYLFLLLIAIKTLSPFDFLLKAKVGIIVIRLKMPKTLGKSIASVVPKSITVVETNIKAATTEQI